MAIITDATGRQLAQAVGGIDTGGLAKDTTLQATNTALGNMNSTQQGISTAITNLGQLLGNDKANISGDNIANQSMFRQNIGLTTGTTELTLTIPTSQVFKQYIKKQYGVVFLYLEINNFKSTTAQTIGYLPDGYRPYHRILADVIVINANDNSFKGYAHFVIQTTGEITLQMQGNYTYPFCTLDISFPISNL